MSDDPRARVRALCNVAANLADAPGPLIMQLVTSTGLSRQGVELGLSRHLEVAPTEDEVSALCASVSATESVLVVLSANVFVAALRAIALAVAAADVVTVRPSRREPHFAAALVQALGDPRVRLDERPDVRGFRSGEIHVYGRDATIATVRAQAAATVRVRGHGAGLGVASVDEGADLQAQARAIAGDVIAFDQRGCLSPRVVLVAAERAEAFGEELHLALDEAESRVPRGNLDASERAEAARYSATAALSGRLFRGTSHLVGVSDALVVPPAGRHVHIVAVDGDLSRARVLAPIVSYVVAVGASDPRAAATWVPLHARVSANGCMQTPRFDGPVDRRSDAIT